MQYNTYLTSIPVTGWSIVREYACSEISFCENDCFAPYLLSPTIGWPVSTYVQVTHTYVRIKKYQKKMLEKQEDEMNKINIEK